MDSCDTSGHVIPRPMLEHGLLVERCEECGGVVEKRTYFISGDDTSNGWTSGEFTVTSTSATSYVIVEPVCQELCPKCGTNVVETDHGYKCKKCRRVWSEKVIRNGLHRPELTNADRRRLQGEKRWR